MQEDFLHYVWKQKAFSSTSLKTTSGASIVILKLGHHNHNSGPDFFNAQLSIDGQLWAGNVEIHIKSSDWYVHGHEKDKAYDNVILHVVWEHDTEVFRSDNSVVPTLELKPIVNRNLITNYYTLMSSKSWINCQTHYPEVDDFVLENWIERLYIERLERKSNDILELLKQSKNDWEAVLFKMLLKNFGLKVNGEAFLSLANSVDYAVIRKLQHNVLDLEALLFGQSGLLDGDAQESYFLDLKQRYQFLAQKFQLNNQGVLPLQFFRLRPPNFPTIRLSQFVNLYVSERQLFSKIMSAETKNEFYNLLSKGVTSFWMTHYTFGKESKALKKVITKPLIDLVVINTIIPLKFSYAKHQGRNINDDLFNLLSEIKQETNSIVNKYMQLKPIKKNALSSQGLLQLKQNYCNKNRCLHCAIGNSLIVKN
ncbi:hypothetical protein BWZ20_05000 [Winogradskyella sp. J14-2]|uniref:DUF2851 family protein n=1 Tax=Winogradskyella sp. J14-2 TaxID=1936080 RepID=UPI000972853D|nr:DUF2851 family protein [Winogradskyella sp. J14-2]APY07692.1 hypothetical protein BWZ20_05000 [Winogradskyella sp. J14-2]